MLRVCVALLALLAITACADSDPDPQAAEASATEPSATPETPVEVAPYVETPTGPVGLTTTEDGAVWVVGAQSETVPADPRRRHRARPDRRRTGRAAARPPRRTDRSG